MNIRQMIDSLIACGVNRNCLGCHYADAATPDCMEKVAEEAAICLEEQQIRIHRLLAQLEEKKVNVPAVDAVEVVHGRWIRNPGTLDIECSNCGRTLECWFDDDAKFCPTCGAKMDGDRNG